MSMRRGVLTIIVALLGALFLASPTATAAGGVTCPPGSTPIKGSCVITVDPGGGGGGGGGTTPVDNPGAGGGSQECRKASGEVVPCQTEHGYWNGSCYDRDVSSEYPADDPIWGGRSEGVIVRTTCPSVGGNAVVNHWEASAPGATGPSPRELADRAVAAMDFQAGQIATAPPPLSVQPDSMAIVGIPVWLWVGDPGESTTGPITRSASGGGITVTATGTLDRIVYTMGDGGQVTCTGPGTPYRPEYGDRTSPDCGYTYTKTSAGKVGEAHTISTTSYWTVEWAGGGQTGTIPLEFTRTEQLRVGELQVLLTTP